MLPQEIIRKKRDGHTLEASDIETYVTGVTTGAVTEGQIAAFCMAVFFRGMTMAERVMLTRAMAQSGTVLIWKQLNLPGPVLDKHSSGGVGDKSSLVLAPIVAACGGFVPMLSGRGLGHTGGTVDKFVGDLIMVLFGAPEGTEEDTVRAVKCAVAMQARRKSLNATSSQPLEIGIGLATGSVVAGCMGSDKRLSYTVLGHHVNLASRLCGIAQPGEIIADATTVKALKGSHQTQPLPPMQLKGFSEPVQPYRIL